MPQDIHGIDLGPSPTPYERAEALAAEAYGAQRTWFLTNGATQGNHALCLALAPLGRPHRRAAQLARVARRRAGALAAACRRSSRPSYDEELGMAHGVTPAALDEALARARAGTAVSAAFVVSPTYYGMVADVAGLAPRSPTPHDVPLVVDQCWGPHFGFHPDLPAGALALGADAVLTSTHKIAGSLTQSAMLHVGRAGTGRDRPRRRRRGRCASLRSTSPSSLLMASLDAARRQLARARRGAAARHARGVEAARAKLDDARRRRARRPPTSSAGPASPARTRCGSSLDVRGTGRTGYEVADALRRSYDVHAELATQATIVLRRRDGRAAGRRSSASPATSRRSSRRIAGPGETAAIVRPHARRSRTSWRSRRARRSSATGRSSRSTTPSGASRASRSPATRRASRRCCRASGSRGDVVAYLREIVASGARLHGASDPSFATVTVLRA